MKTLLIADAMLALPMTATAQERSDRTARSNAAITPRPNAS